MTKKSKKHVRERGKVKLSKYFQVLSEGQRVVVDAHKASDKKHKGMVGTILGKQGDAYIVSIKEGRIAKKLIVKPLHLKKL